MDDRGGVADDDHELGDDRVVGDNVSDNGDVEDIGNARADDLVYDDAGGDVDDVIDDRVGCHDVDECDVDNGVGGSVNGLGYGHVSGVDFDDYYDTYVDYLVDDHVR